MGENILNPKRERNNEQSRLGQEANQKHKSSLQQKYFIRSQDKYEEEKQENYAKSDKDKMKIVTNFVKNDNNFKNLHENENTSSEQKRKRCHDIPSLEEKKRKRDLQKKCCERYYEKNANEIKQKKRAYYEQNADYFKH